MASRTDQLHSYQFAVQRVVSALVAHESNPARPPGRRAGAALLAGLLVAALGVAGFAVWGLLQPGGSTRWRSADAVILEKETGAKYVYVNGRLHPVANYSSALLIVGARRTVSVARRSLAGVPRGAVLGIPGAPDALPGRRELVGGPWSVCSFAGASGGASGGAEGGPRSVVSAGVAWSGGVSLGDAGLLVSTSDGSVHLVWQGRRSLVREPSVVLGILVWNAPVAVSPGFLNALPAAADLTRIAVPGRGQPFRAVAGARVGQVFVVDGRQHVVALAGGGLAPVSAFQAALLLGDPLTVELVGQKAATPLSAGEYASIPRGELPGSRGDLPADLPRLVSPPAGTAVCAVAGGEIVVGTRPRTGVALRGGSSPGGSPVTGGAAAGVLADEALLPAGRGAIVASSGDAAAEVLHFVTDLGIRHPVPSVEVLAVLGFGGVVPVRLPVEIVTLLPAGPALYPQAARTPLGG